MRVALVVVVLSFLRICGSEAPPMPPGTPGAMPGMPGAVPGPVAAPGMPGVPGMPMAPGVPGLPPVGPTPVVAPPGPMGVPGAPVVPAPPAAPTAVTEVVAGPHQGTLLTTAAAKFEIALAPSGEVKVYVTDAAGAALAPTDVSIPVMTFEGSTGVSVVVLQPGEGFLHGTAAPAPAADARVRFDAIVRGAAVPGVTATLVAAAAPTPPPTAEAVTPTPAPEQPAQPAQPPTKNRPSKRPPANATTSTGRHGPPQAQTFAPQPLGPSANPVRGNVSGSNNGPRPVQVNPGPRSVTVTPGSGVRSN